MKGQIYNRGSIAESEKRMILLIENLSATWRDLDSAHREDMVLARKEVCKLSFIDREGEVGQTVDILKMKGVNSSTVKKDE